MWEYYDRSDNNNDTFIIEAVMQGLNKRVLEVVTRLGD